MYNVEGQRVSGGSFPARVWHDFMDVAMANQEVLDWPRPPEELRYTVLPPAPDPQKDQARKKKGGGGDEGQGQGQGQDRRKPGKPRKPRKPGPPGGNG